MHDMCGLVELKAFHRLQVTAIGLLSRYQLVYICNDASKKSGLYEHSLRFGDALY